jgi:hypothetical protein
MIKPIFCFFLIALSAIPISIFGTNPEPIGDITATLFAQYDRFREPSLTHRRFKHRDILPLIQALPFEKKVAGESFEGRAIYHITLGQGKTPILLWSQMHGDESTATMALFDIFRFFQAAGDEFDGLRQKILRGCHLHFVPMLNPDGAERFQRRTATEIDMNRDALRLQTPEGVLLKNFQQILKPAFAFNLHDQGTRTSAGNSPHQATISFLATAYDTERNWNKVRRRSMQVICEMNETLQKFIPNQVAKYSDEYEPRAFGDNIQKWGSSLILIESGGYRGDTEKQFIRKLNFVAILRALEAIADGSYRKYKRRNYEALPTNDNALFDLLIRNVVFEEKGKKLVKDIGINLNERNLENATLFTTDSRVDDLGDLSIFWGIQEIDATGLSLRFLKDFATELNHLNLSPKQVQTMSLQRGSEANFVLIRQGQIVYIVLNGQVQTAKNK